jgi:hypothetical protein
MMSHRLHKHKTEPPGGFPGVSREDVSRKGPSVPTPLLSFPLPRCIPLFPEAAVTCPGDRTAPCSEEPAPGQWAAGDRVLLYIRGLGIQPARGLSLAARSLEEAPASPEGAMDALERLLREEGFSADIMDRGGRRISSFPPLNRTVMVAEEMDRLPWRTSLVRFLRRWSRELFGGKTNG